MIRQTGQIKTERSVKYEIFSKESTGQFYKIG